MKLPRYNVNSGHFWDAQEEKWEQEWVRASDVDKLEKRIEALEEGLRTIAECSSDAVARICAVCTLGEEEATPNHTEEKE